MKRLQMILCASAARRTLRMISVVSAPTLQPSNAPTELGETFPPTAGPTALQPKAGMLMACVMPS